MKISNSAFTIEANGFADGPAQPFRDYLIAHKARRVVFINHPLVAEGSNEHVVTIYEAGEVTEKKYNLPNKPPYTFAFDLFVPFITPPSDAWFGFNNLSAYKGLRLKRRGKVKKVYYWAVDFVPNRFGSSPLTKLYNKLDRIVTTRADARIELSQAALEGRSAYLGIKDEELSPGLLIPMGTWLDRTPKVSNNAWESKKIVFMGHLVERQGVFTLLEATKKIIQKDNEVTLDIVGGGPLLQELKARAKELNISKQVTFHGFVKDYGDVETILASGAVAAAPYMKDPNNFTQFADPGKLKAYLGAHLPIVLTDVPPNAQDLAVSGSAIIAEDDPLDFSDKLFSLLHNKNTWEKAHAAAKKEAKQFDWNTLFGAALKKLGYKD